MGVPRHHRRRAGRTDQRDAGDAAGPNRAFSTPWRTTACCRKNSSPPSIPSSARPGRTRSWWVLLAAVVGSVTPIDDIGKMVNIGTLLAFVIVCIAIMILRKRNRTASSVPHAVGAVRARSWASVQRLHDVQAGLGELGATDYLAGHRPGDLLHLWPPPQPRAEDRCT